MYFLFRITDDQNKIYEELLSEQEEIKDHIPLQLARLQQMENQLKLSEYQSNIEKKDQKLNEIIRFIQEKLFPLMNEDSILKFFGQKNFSASNEKENQSMKTLTIN